MTALVSRRCGFGALEGARTVQFKCAFAQRVGPSVQACRIIAVACLNTRWPYERRLLRRVAVQIDRPVGSMLLLLAAGRRSSCFMSLGLFWIARLRPGRRLGVASADGARSFARLR